ncbi:MAG: LysM peptidoglycan-binding domain-containing protein [Candidatus Moranbacteria bacterium]|nr:LysM peptidoglycan-binding domain-containing protein [Candidatus Moranbacteria bacterium]
MIIALSTGLLGRDNFKSLLAQIHIGQKNIINFIKERRTIKLLHIFRHYSALIVVISSAILVSATNLAAGKESSGFLFGYLGSTADNYASPLENKMFVGTDNKKDLAMVPLLQSSTAPDPEKKPNDESESELVTMQGQALIAGTSPVKKDPEEDGGVTIYEVQSGDTVGAIASKFHITTNTILWANEIDDINSIMPGDKIFILPVAGLTYTVKSSDTIDSIAKKYKADEAKIISFNDLPANGELKAGQEIVIPDGQKEIIQPAVPKPTATTGIVARQYESFETIGKKLSGSAGAGHKFPYGYCTWYVAQRKYVPWGGNAGTWLYHAKSMGYATGRTPKVGSIMVSSESWWGHVGIVESVSGGSFTVSEMNYKGFAKKSYRTVSTGSRAIKGFIY